MVYERAMGRQKIKGDGPKRRNERDGVNADNNKRILFTHQRAPESGGELVGASHRLG